MQADSSTCYSQGTPPLRVTKEAAFQLLSLFRRAVNVLSLFVGALAGMNSTSVARLYCRKAKRIPNHTPIHSFFHFVFALPLHSDPSRLTMTLLITLLVLIISPVAAFVQPAVIAPVSKSSTELFRLRKDEAEVPPVPVRFLGRGQDAIVRPGCVLLAPKHEFHHFYRQSAIFIYGMGEAPDHSNDYLIRGLIIDHPTPFTLEEMMDHNPRIAQNPLGQNFLFRGGDKGQEGVILLHNQHAIFADNAEEYQIGQSGIYQGGWQGAMEMLESPPDAQANDGSHEQFKAFFNYCEFTEKELEDLLDSEEDGDAWVSLEVPPEFVLDQDWDRGDAWRRLRNTVKQMEL